MAQKEGQDQFADSTALGNFPLYTEPDIEFLPTYKMEAQANIYKNKKD